MRLQLLTLLFPVLALLSSCGTSIQKKEKEKTASGIDTAQPGILKKTHLLKETTDTVHRDVKPVLGYRFIVAGDFDGDGKKEKLTERYFSSLDNKETNKFYDSLSDYSQLVALTVKKEPYSFAVCDNKVIDTLHISSVPQLLGLSFLKNEGDLNGDGTDELSYVVNWADWSNVNTWHLMTYRKRKWTELYSFSIWDWQLPDLPGTFNQYGLIGLHDKKINTGNDTINRRTEKELLAFKGLLKKMKTNKIQVIFKNDEAEIDTMQVDLKRRK